MRGPGQARFLWIVAIAAMVGAVGVDSTGAVYGAEPESTVVKKEYRPLVPHRLLQLLHAPEVHRELELSSAQIADLEKWFSDVDGPWFRSRLMKEDEQLAEVDRIEARTRQWLSGKLNAKQNSRLRQLEYQAVGTRMLLRNDVAQKLKLTAAQQQKFAEVATKSVEAVSKSKDTSEAIKTENEAVRSLLSGEQTKRLSETIGEIFDTQNLRRIFPMAPELIAVENWHNSQPLTLKSLRGKVVLVHFYAFQCHNCQANFDIYKRWHEKLAEKGVVVLGIQTPETKTERDPAAVCKAANDNGLKFPILVDLDSANWKAWGNTMWPTVYVVDKQGYIRHWWQGELNWQGATGDKTIEQIVDAALAE